jgi:hypothetical protein
VRKWIQLQVTRLVGCLVKKLWEQTTSVGNSACIESEVSLQETYILLYEIKMKHK